MPTYTDFIVQSPYTHVEAQAQFDLAAASAAPYIRVIFPAATHVWTGYVSTNQPATCQEFHIMGMGAEIDGVGTDQTIIQDNWGSSGVLWDIGGLTNKVRIHDFRFGVGSSFVYKNDWIRLFGVISDFRIHHVACRPGDDLAGGAGNCGNLFRMFDYIRGVIDHCHFRFAGSGGIFHPRYTYPDGEGDTYWAQPTQYGGDEMVYVEDCLIGSYYNGAVEDAEHGSSWCVRFNKLETMNLQGHPIVKDRNRGMRHCEIYCNDVGNPYGDNNQAKFNFMYVPSGTAIIWNNPLTHTDYGYNNYITIHCVRRDLQTYGNSSLPHGWGFAGLANNFMAGNVSTVGTAVTKLDGNDWSGGSGQTAWALTADALIIINGVQYTVASLDSPTTLTLTTSAGTQGPVMSYPLNNCDGNTDSYGYPCIDQPGRGQGDLLANAFGTSPGVVNTNRSSADYTSPDLNPRQTKEPLYFFKNPGTVNVGGGGSYIGNYNPEVVQENRDFFCQQDSSGVTKSNSTAMSSGGVGEGDYATMQSFTPTYVGTGWWVTDRGNWNDGHNSFYTGQGQLWIWNGSSWEFLYEPAPFPHYLITQDEEPVSSVILMGQVLT